MPNPFKQRLSDVAIDHPQALLRHPDLAAQIGMVAASWQGVENELGSIFTCLLGGEEGAALEIFNSLIDRNLRKQALQAVAKGRLPHALLLEAEALFVKARKLSGRRSDVVHATWITIPTRPNALIRIDPADISKRFHRRITQGLIMAIDLSLAKAGIPSLGTPLGSFEHEFSLMEYKKRDFEILLKDIEAFRNKVTDLSAKVLLHVLEGVAAERLRTLPPQVLRTLEARQVQPSQTNPSSPLSPQQAESCPQE